LTHHYVVHRLVRVKRMSVTLTERIEQTVEQLGIEGRMRRALEDWYAQRGEAVDLDSESARLRALLDVADVTIRDWVLDAGYEHMAAWHNERDEAERPAWRRRRERSAAQWTAQE
jgi:hypothetical protein